ncbi:hypothetical protein PVK06_024767 [Gossypium arboreum]|uniref:Uncharacterized protein n=1 Tax=Gossypium arboreum TaxID=29729 RepID=A0ABR0PET4_GOSAR|nr:hypothetical protein PVK06_024767 [Gossypium arboreum]
MEPKSEVKQKVLNMDAVGNRSFKLLLFLIYMIKIYMIKAREKELKAKEAELNKREQVTEIPFNNFLYCWNKSYPRSRSKYFTKLYT